MNDKLKELLKLESKEILLSFQKASIEGVGTPQEIADRREVALVNSFLGKYFPFPYKIVKGNIIDSYGANSASIDSIILHPDHPYTIDPKNQKASIILADGVDAVIEIKSNLNNKDELARALTQIQTVKKLNRKRDSIWPQMTDISQMVELAPIEFKPMPKYTYKIPCFIFAIKSYSNMGQMLFDIANYYKLNNISEMEQFDYMVILDENMENSKIIFNSRKNSYIYLGDKRQLCYIETKDDTLLYFLFFLNRNPQSTPLMDSSVLDPYLKLPDLFKTKTCEEANLILENII